jgi:hypothetical protein
VTTLLTNIPAGDPRQPPTATLRGVEVRRLTLRPLDPDRPGASRATLRLPGSTPPGTYEGVAEIGCQRLDIAAEVEPSARLEAEPRRISIQAGPGETVTIALTLVNTGNVPCNVSGVSTFCLFAGGGVDHAVWAALASDAPPDTRRIDVLLDDLARLHGGLVTARVARGVKIAPGEARTARLSLRFSGRLQPGARYAGQWEAEGLRVPVRVTTRAAG